MSEIMLLIGPNRSGKTRLLKAMESMAGARAEYVSDCNQPDKGEKGLSQGEIAFKRIKEFIAAAKKLGKPSVLLADGVLERLDSSSFLQFATLAQGCKNLQVIAATRREDMPSRFPKGTRLNVMLLAEAKNKAEMPSPGLYELFEKEKALCANLFRAEKRLSEMMDEVQTVKTEISLLTDGIEAVRGCMNTIRKTGGCHGQRKI